MNLIQRSFSILLGSIGILLFPSHLAWSELESPDLEQIVNCISVSIAQGLSQEQALQRCRRGDDPPRRILNDVSTPVNQIFACGRTYSLSDDQEVLSNQAEEDDRSDLDEIDWGPWLEDLQEKIDSSWDPPSVSDSLETLIRFEVELDTRIVNICIAEPSGNRVVDRRAVLAVQRSAPPDPLPEEFEGNLVTINFAFDINVEDN